MEIRKGLRLLPTVRMLVGCIDGPIFEKNISQEFDESKILPRLATKVMRLFLVSLDGTIGIPFHFYATSNVSGSTLIQEFDKLKGLFQKGLNLLPLK